jgi:hypothetical protein
MLKLSDYDNKQKNIVSEYVAIAANSYKEYDLQTLAGVNHTLFDLDAANVNVRLKEIAPASLKFDTYVGIGNTTHGIYDNRYVRVFNESMTESIDAYIAIDIPVKITV